MERTILLLAALSTALLSGLFYAWSCSVMPGLARLSDQHYLHAMQAMNRAILNPIFFLSFFGASILLPLCAWQQVRVVGASEAALAILAAVVLWVGMMGVTVFVNVPMNNLLEAAHLDTASPGELKELRALFQGSWTRWNNVRTVATTLALLLLLLHILRSRGIDAPFNLTAQP